MIPGYIPKYFSKRDHSKIITSFHGGPGTEGQANQIKIQKLKKLRISIVSTQIAKRVKEYKLGKLWFTPHGVNVDIFTQDKIYDKFTCGYAGWAKYLLKENKSDLRHIYQNEHRRGYWIIQAFNQFKFDLSIAAGIEAGGMDAERYIQRVKGSCVSNSGKLKIQLYEHTTMPEFYKDISCYLVPDRFAGGPVPVLEAGAMGIPVVCTNAGLCGDIIENGVHGIIIRNEAEFLQAIKWMKHHPYEREEMGRNLQKYIRKHRTWNAVSEYWEDFING
jgi:glycosyltransferase involved in cell wall biosynthesis